MRVIVYLKTSTEKAQCLTTNGAHDPGETKHKTGKNQTTLI
jgi:hypothetical protein